MPCTGGGGGGAAFLALELDNDVASENIEDVSELSCMLTIEAAGGAVGGAAGGPAGGKDGGAAGGKDGGATGGKDWGKDGGAGGAAGGKDGGTLGAGILEGKLGAFGGAGGSDILEGTFGAADADLCVLFIISSSNGLPDGAVRADGDTLGAEGAVAAEKLSCSFGALDGCAALDLTALSSTT